MKSKSTGFRLEVRLGLALIILTLLTLNFASHYALFRIRSSLETQIKDELTEAAVVAAGYISKIKSVDLPDSSRYRIKAAYSLDTLAVIPVTYERALAISDGHRPDSVFLGLDKELTAEELLPILRNQPVYIHRSGSIQNLFFLPTELIGSKYIIVAARRNAILGSVENAGIILIFFGLLGIGIIIYVSYRLAHFVTNPFEKLRKKAVESGRMDGASDDEISSLILSYEKIIDDLKQKEKELVRLNEINARRAEDLEVYNNYILKSINTGVVAVDREGKISSVNRAALEILGLKNGEALGENCQDVLGNHSVPLTLIKNYKEKGIASDSCHFKFTGADGTTRSLIASISPLTNSQGANIGFSLILNDETEYDRLQEELELNRRMACLGEMSGGLAHQLRNSIAAIIGFARLMEKKISDDSGLQDKLNSLLREANDASLLIGRFLDFARPLVVEPTGLDIDSILKEIAAVLQGKHEPTRISVCAESAGDFMAQGDALLIKQALTNIIDNACRAASISGDGAVMIKYWISARGTKIEISDNGRGIPDNIRDKIFTPFFSSDPAGAGLGLPLARKIISLHGGRIDFVSVEGQGTTFTVVLPSVKATIPAPQSEKATVS
jgi:PAS domain S-box-containing protein